MITGCVFHIEEMSEFLELFINDPIFSKILDSGEQVHTSVSSEIHDIFSNQLSFIFVNQLNFLPIITLN